MAPEVLRCEACDERSDGEHLQAAATLSVGLLVALVCSPTVRHTVCAASSRSCLDCESVDAPWDLILLL
jgi:hypothetical protein